MTNAKWMVKKHISAYELLHDDNFINSLGEKYGAVFDVNRAFIKWLDAEHVEPILDDAEKRYLSAVIRPFRDKVTAICKINDFESDYIAICLEFESVCLPDFPAGTMYKGMKKGHDYTLEELGL